MQDWMTSQETAAYLGISQWTLYHWVNTRRVPFYKPPGSSLLRFSRKRLDAWLASGEVQTTDEYLKGG